MEQAEQKRHNKKVVLDTLNAVHSTHNISQRDKDIARYVLEKTYRIAGAVQRLCNFTDTNDTILDTLADTALGLIKDAALFPYSRTARTRLQTNVLALSALFESARIAGVVEDRTATIFINNLNELVSFLHTVYSGNGVALSDEDVLRVDVPKQVYAPMSSVEPPYAFEGHIKDTQVHKHPYRAPDIPFTEQTLKKDNASHSIGRYKDRVQEAQKDRRAIILGLLQKKRQNYSKRRFKCYKRL